MIQTHIEDESKVSLALFPDCALCVDGEDILPLVTGENIFQYWIEVTQLL